VIGGRIEKGKFPFIYAEDGIHHIDGTYKITSYGYPLINYGVSDKCGQFHPVAFVITSHKTTEDLKLFYEALIDICKTLMCYFHVNKNVRDHKKLMPHENFDDLMRFLTKIHYSHNKDEFKKNINAFKKSKLINRLNLLTG
jgi:hypothetical protein